MKNNAKNTFIGLLLVLFGGTFTSCEAVKPYQKSKINDSEMVLANRKIQKTENSFQTYREGASGASGGKTGGGCGCN
ncbi:DUF4266 domain-containing protein [Flavobacterium antarcticum]|uniref:DUF4266 domain-containing protein n=1 Tax=Flavobacterium antarcticum TaxID=271155 RepID=UPI0003B52A83|nr:DUF4266 domain-containing protein [Flavobacterium antarcticum]